ncbi:DsbA family protein [Oceanobacillus locisalsi]|uniref:DsbA family protein n=1 Tax=Oceanobacillus locisalsi TaxID=546107 RepID=A0ABW3NJS5_9BACI
MRQENMICDVETGLCGEADGEEMETFQFNQPKKEIDIYYVTDPICSHCWALEPVLRRFLTQFEQYFKLHTVMGGLLEKWSDTSVDPANGISGPADVVGHWKEVGEHSRMPIDGSLMADDYVTSSYPPSRVFKVIQKEYNDNLAYTFLRHAREALFAFNRNISDAAILIELIEGLGLDGEKIVQQADSALGHQLLEEDFNLKDSLGVRGFPTIIMVNQEGQGIKIVGARTFEDYVSGLQQVLPSETLAPKQVPAFADLLKQENLLFSKEVEALYDLENSQVQSFAEKELATADYQVHELLGEQYYTLKK